MRVLSVRQPWAWAIVHGGKDVENRGRNIAGGYRGPVAIHAGLAYAEDAHIWLNGYLNTLAIDDDGSHRQPRGAIIGVVDIVGVHDSRLDGCGARRGTARPGELIPLCSDWAEPWAHHLVLANPRQMAEPIPFRGALGMRTLPADVEAAVLAEVAL